MGRRGGLRVDDHVGAEEVAVPVNELMPVSVAVSTAKDTDSLRGRGRSAYAIFAKTRGVSQFRDRTLQLFLQDVSSRHFSIRGCR